MKISGSSDKRPIEPLERGANGTRSASTPAASPASASESVSISGLSTQLKQLETQLVSGEEFDAARVDAITQAVRDGRFKVNADVVADKLIESALELTGQVR